MRVLTWLAACLFLLGVSVTTILFVDTSPLAQEKAILLRKGDPQVAVDPQAELQKAFEETNALLDQEAGALLARLRRAWSPEILKSLATWDSDAAARPSVKKALVERLERLKDSLKLDLLLVVNESKELFSAADASKDRLLEPNPLSRTNVLVTAGSLLKEGKEIKSVCAFPSVEAPDCAPDAGGKPLETNLFLMASVPAGATPGETKAVLVGGISVQTLQKAVHNGLGRRAGDFDWRAFSTVKLSEPTVIAGPDAGTAIRRELCAKLQAETVIEERAFSKPGCQPGRWTAFRSHDGRVLGGWGLTPTQAFLERVPAPPRTGILAQTGLLPDEKIELLEKNWGLCAGATAAFGLLWLVLLGARKTKGKGAGKQLKPGAPADSAKAGARHHGTASHDDIASQLEINWKTFASYTQDLIQQSLKTMEEAPKKAFIELSGQMAKLLELLSGLRKDLSVQTAEARDGVVAQVARLIEKEGKTRKEAPAAADGALKKMQGDLEQASTQIEQIHQAVMRLGGSSPGQQDQAVEHRVHLEIKKLQKEWGEKMASYSSEMAEAKKQAERLSAEMAKAKETEAKLRAELKESASREEALRRGIQAEKSQAEKPKLEKFKADVGAVGAGGTSKAEQELRGQVAALESREKSALQRAALLEESGRKLEKSLAEEKSRSDELRREMEQCRKDEEAIRAQLEERLKEEGRLANALKEKENGLESERKSLGEKTSKLECSARSALERLAVTEEELRRTKESLRQREEALGAQSRAVEALRRENSALAEKTANFTKNIESSRAEVSAQIAAQLKLLEEVKKDAAGKLEQSRVEQEKARAELGAARSELEKERAKSGKLAAELEEARGGMEKTRAELGAARSELEKEQAKSGKLGAELEAHRSQRKASDAAALRVEEEMKSLHMELQLKGEELERLSTHTSSRDAEVLRVKLSLDEARGDLEKERAKCATLAAELEAQRNSFKSPGNLASKGLEEAKALRRELQSKSEEVERLRAAHAALEKEAATAKEALQASRAELEKRKSSTGGADERALREAMQKTAMAVKADMACIEEKYKAAEARSRAAETENQALKAKVAELEKLKAAQGKPDERSLKDALQKAAEAVNADVKRMEEGLRPAEARCRAAEMENQALKAKVAELEKLKAAQGKPDERALREAMQKTAMAVKADMACIEEKYKAAEARSRTAETENQALKAKVAELEKLKAAQGKPDDRALKDAVEKATEAVKADVQRTQEGLKAAEARCRATETDNQALRAKVAELEKKLAEGTNIKREPGKPAEQVKADVRRIEEGLKVAEARCRAAETENLTLRTRVAELERKAAEAGGAKGEAGKSPGASKAEAQRLEENLKSAESRARGAEDDKNRLKALLAEGETAWRTKCAELEVKLAASERKLVEACRKFTDSDRRVAQAESNAREIQTQMDFLKANLTAPKDYQEKLRSLESEKTELLLTRGQILTELQSLQDEVEGFRRFQRVLVGGNLPAPIVAADKSLKVFAWNPAATSLWGRGADEVIGRELAELALDGERQVILDSAKKALVEKKSAEIPRISITDSSGKERFIRGGCDPILGPQGKAIGVILMLTELTEQVQSEIDARCQGLLTNGLVRSFPGGLIVLDKQDRVVIWNTSVEAMFAIGESVAVGQDFFTLKTPLSKEAFQRIFEERKKDCAPHRYPVRFEFRGSPARFIVTQTPFLSADGDSIGTLLLLEKATEPAAPEKDKP